MLAPEKTSEAAALLQRGITLAQQGQKDYAKQLLQEAAQADPNSEAAWLWLASLYTEPSEMTIAAYCLQRVVAINPGNTRANQALQAIMQRVAPARTAPQHEASVQAPAPTPQTAPQQAAPQQAPAPLPAAEPQRAPQASPQPSDIARPEPVAPSAQAQEKTPAESPAAEVTPMLAGDLAAWGRPAEPAQPAQPAVTQPQAGAEGEALGYDELKRRGIVAAKGGRREEARGYLLAATELNDADAESWHWLSTVVDDPEDKQIALENALTLNPLDEAARAAWEENNALLKARVTHGAQPAAQAIDLAAAGMSFLYQSGPLNQSGPLYPSGPLNNEDTQMAQPVPAMISGSLLMHPAGVTPQVSASQAGKGGAISPGSVIASKYRVLSVHPGVVGTDYTTYEVNRKRFYTLRAQKTEVEDLKKLKANYVVHDRTPYTVVPIGTEGFTLRNFIGTVGVLPPELAVGYALAMVKSLQALHAKGPTLTASKSLTPDSVAFGAEGDLNLEPEGLKAQPPDAFSNRFLPPEQVSKGGIAPTSDIYAVGALLYYMLTGDTPPTPENMPKKQGDTFSPSYFAGHAGIPEKLFKVLATAMQPNPQERYASARDFGAALEATGLAVDTSSSPSTPLVLGAVGLVLVVVLALLVVTGKLGNIQLPFLKNDAPKQVVYLPPTATVVVAQPTVPPPPPLGKVAAHSVGTRRFPTNSLFFSALDNTGAPMPGLTTDMVKVTDNGGDGTNLQLVALNRTTDPVSVIFALDNSMLMAGKPLDDAKTAIHQFVNWLQPGDQMALLTFGGRLRYPVDYTVSKTEFLTAVDAVQPNGKADIFPGVVLAAERTATQPQGGYTAMIIISNGGLPAAKSSIVATTHAANLANLPVFFVGLDKATYSEAVANQLASDTGGLAVVAEVADAGGATLAIKKVDDEIHNVYKLTYDSPNLDTKGEHTVVVTVKAGGVEQSDTRKYQVLK